MKKIFDSLFSSASVRYVFLNLLGLMAFLSLMRFGFFLYFRSEDPGAPLAELLYAFFLGAKFDLRLALICLAPWVLFHRIPPLNFLRSSWAAYGWRIYFSIATSIAFIFYLFDFAYYSYLHTRLNATILRFAQDPLISAEMMWQSYPVLWLTLAIVVFFIGSLQFFQFCINYFKSQSKLEPLPDLKIWQRATVTLILATIFCGGIYGKFGYYPLRWSEAFFSPNLYTSHLALNPIHYFFDTLTNHDTGFEPAKVKTYHSKVAKYLNIKNPDPNQLLLQRPLRLTPNLLKKTRPNIVVIVMESLAAYKTSAFGHPLNPTPHIKKIADKGLLFTNYYTPSEGTARSIFCLISGVPDLNSRRTSSRNPLVVDQNTLANAFTNYEKYYFIGGSANWGNIRGVIGNNVLGVKIIEEGDFQVERTDVWGLSDLQLFEEAHRILDDRTSNKPFFAVIQAASFHRPYTIPDQRGSFKEKNIEPSKLLETGFLSNKEFNSIRFSDYSLGEFFRLARTSPYFNDTLFVIIGDHGLPDNRAKQLSKASVHFAFERFHTPLVFYAPQLLNSPPKKIDLMASEPDVFATLAGMTNHPFSNSSLGRNLFAVLADSSPSYAFVSAYYTSPLQIGLIGKRFYALGTAQGMDGLYDLNSDDPSENVRHLYPEEFKNMSDLTLGLYQSSRYLLYNNSKSLGLKN